MSDARPDWERSRAANRSLWDAWTAVHEHAPFYDLAGFREGGIRLADYELEEIGPVDGLSLLHLQCHFGIDTLSWARLGARVTGVDLSPRAVALATRLAGELGLDARFIESDIYALPERLDDTFDLVYTSRGVLGWLPDIRGWARVVARFVRPGGRFYVTDIHPVAQAFENEGVQPGELRLQYPYWEHEAPLVFPVKGSYADPDADIGVQEEHGWDHGLGEIVTALIDAGLEIRSLREHDFIEWPVDFLVRGDDGRYRLPPSIPGQMPLFFSLLAARRG
ncbi:MAG TPA: class I SAM-dependent methyltransferase [Candidatus Limnocylindrales bacterium]|nr:class I SAM-dependent methyltransferase [Candidatus Limnocylindrales bacterium]